MPTYTYECEKHGEFEWQHSIKDQLEECPYCKKENEGTDKPPQAVKRLISGGTGFMLKGGGWASEGYK